LLNIIETKTKTNKHPVSYDRENIANPF